VARARKCLLGEVHAAYVRTRGKAARASVWRLRCQARRLGRRRDRLDQPALARLRALLDELRDREVSA
jgi:hypothetical protein